MLFAEDRREDRVDLKLAELWTEVHSEEAAMDGLKLALLVEWQSMSQINSDLQIGPIMVAWFEGSTGDLFRMRMTMKDFLQFAGDFKVKDVLLARPGLDDRLEAFLRNIPFDREIKGQTNGFWFGPGEEIPDSMPSYFCTGAVLFRKGSDGMCLDLVPIDFMWYPLSEAAIYTYSHSAGLKRKERWTFVAADRSRWPLKYVAELGDPIEKKKARKEYGDAAGSRARGDVKAVQLRLRLERE